MGLGLKSKICLIHGILNCSNKTIPISSLAKVIIKSIDKHLFKSNHTHSSLAKVIIKGIERHLFKSNCMYTNNDTFHSLSFYKISTRRTDIKNNK